MFKRLGCGGCGLACGLAAAALAWHHPLWPVQILGALVLWTVVLVWQPGIWLCAVPAGVAFLNFSPWTGWLVWDEFDILLLGSLAAGYARLAMVAPQAVMPPPPRDKLLTGLALLWLASGLQALVRGFFDAGGNPWDWYADYTAPLNSVRIFKSLGFTLLFAPLVCHQLAQNRLQASRWLGGGMLAGLGLVGLAVVWERAAFPGLRDFSSNYRTVGLFWEMHVGGAAIDAYLALATPFSAWAVLRARHKTLWLTAALLVLLTAYAVLTTFARGVYLAVALPMVLAWGTRVYNACVLTGWRKLALVTLVLALAAEVALVLVGGTFLRERLASTDADLGHRARHWQHGIALLDSPTNWLWGIGLGRLPARYAARVPEGEFSGTARWEPTTPGAPSTQGYARLQGPPRNQKLGGQYALTQRVSALGPGPYQVSLQARVREPADLQVELCQRHLLYDGACRMAHLHIEPDNTVTTTNTVNAAWQTRTVWLNGPDLQGSAWAAIGHTVFSLSVVNAGGTVDLDQVRLRGQAPHALLQNGDFSRGLSHWLGSAQSYFLPWHIDNLFLETLIERGLSGLAVGLALVGRVLLRLVRAATTGDGVSACLAACLCGVLTVGLVSSVMDVPRVAFLMGFLALFGVQAAKYAQGPPTA